MADALDSGCLNMARGVLVITRQVRLLSAYGQENPLMDFLPYCKPL